MKTITETVAGLVDKLRYDPSKDTLDELIQAAQATTDTYEPVDEAKMKAIELRNLGFKDLANKLEAKISKRDKLNKITQLKYIAIQEKDIHDFLDRRVKRYNDTLLKSSAQTESNQIVSQSIWPKSIWSTSTSNAAWTTGASDSGFHIYQPTVDQYNFTTQEPMYYYGVDRISESVTEAPRKMISIRKTTKDYHKSTGIGQFIYEEIPIDIYTGVPPQNVLESLKEHKQNKCFDYFTIGLVKQIKDPILWGRVDDDERRWFIKQWGTDISLDDLLK